MSKIEEDISISRAYTLLKKSKLKSLDLMYLKGFLDALYLYADMKDGVFYVDSYGTTISEAIEAKFLNYPELKKIKIP